MAVIKHPDTADKAGDYNLSHIDLINHKGEIIDLKYIVVEMNIYESIYKNAVTGSVVITDAKNQMGRLEVQGLERIAFKLFSPGTNDASDQVDASVETGEPFHVYKITDRKQVNQGLLVYTLHFASREFMRNIRTKVSQAYKGRPDSMVQSILKDPEYLDTRKKLKYERCANSDTIVIPNMRPFDAINMIATKSLPDKSDGVGYYFYETVKSFHFRSWESMVSSQGTNVRPIKQKFYYMPLKYKDEAVGNKIQHDFQSVQEYRFINNFHDVAANTAMGTYAHNVITYNIFDKSYQKIDYNYEYEFAQTKHTEVANEKSDRERYAVAASSFVDEDEKKISDYNESRVSLQSTTQFLHNEEKGAGYGINVLQDGRKYAERESQINQVTNGTSLHMVVKGQSYIEAGDLINFNMLAVDSYNLDNLYDPQYSGKYVITKIRHQVNSQKYTMALECAKDSVKRGFSLNDFKIQKNRNVPDLRNTYSAEDPEPYGSL